MTHAEIRWMFDHANMTDEEEDELLPWTFDNKPLPMNVAQAKWRVSFYTRAGPEIRECIGEIHTFEDGSFLRLDDRDTVSTTHDKTP